MTETERSAAPPDRPVYGALMITTGLGVICVQDVIIKLMSGSFPVWEIAVARSVVACALIALLFVAFKRTAQFRPNRPGLIAMRGLLTFGGYTCFYLALAVLPLAEAVSIFFLAPLIVTALSVPLLGERVGVRRWSAVVVGFVGVLIMLRPGFDAMQPELVLALGAPLCYSLALIITRRIGFADAGGTLVFYNMMMFGAAAAAGSLILHALALPAASHPSLAFLIREWTLPAWSQAGLMALTGVITAVAHFCSVQAYRSAPPSFVSAFEYTYFVWALALGYAVWGEVPDALTFVGVAVVMGSGAYVLHRERVVRRASK